MHGAGLNTVYSVELCFVHLRRPPYVQGPSSRKPLFPTRTTAEVSHARESGFPTTDGLWSFKSTGEPPLRQIGAQLVLVCSCGSSFCQMPVTPAVWKPNCLLTVRR